VCAVLMLLNGTVALAQSAADTAGGEAGLSFPTCLKSHSSAWTATSC